MVLLIARVFFSRFKSHIHSPLKIPLKLTSFARKFTNHKIPQKYCHNSFKRNVNFHSNSNPFHRSFSSSINNNNTNNSKDIGEFPGAPNVPFCYEPEMRDTLKTKPFEIYRCMDEEGNIIKPSTFELPFTEQELFIMYENMHRTAKFDDIFEAVQRIGQISFYMKNTGEEACQVGSGAAWKSEDVMFFQYRELGTFFQRGFPMQQCADVCFSNCNDYNLGKQMPVHYGSKKLNLVTISSTLATQMPQAAGAAYALKRSKKDACVICYFGEGAASEGDAHAGFNFSATMNAPIIWFCRNNGYAISTPTEDQYKGDGIACRAYSYGMVGARFDGNDLFASYIISKKAREICVGEQRPLILEAMTYRAGNHSTSDDASTYRSKEEQELWDTKYNPIRRVRMFMERELLWDNAKEKQLLEKVEQEVDDARMKSEATLKPHWKEMFTDVYAEMTPNLIEQRDELEKHLEVYGSEQYYKLHTHSNTMRDREEHKNR